MRRPALPRQPSAATTTSATGSSSLSRMALTKALAKMACDCGAGRCATSGRNSRWQMQTVATWPTRQP
jgi:hypothetical protein